MYRSTHGRIGALAVLGLLVATTGCASSGGGNDVFVPPARPAEFSLAGIPWGISADSTTALISPRGYNYNKTDEDGDLWYDGMVYRTPTRIYGFMAGDQLVRFRMVLITPDETAITTYATARAELVKQFGVPKETIEEYEAPYARGDEKQIEAFRAEKATMRTYWLPASGPMSLVSIQVSEDLTVFVDYESAAWNKEMVRRRQAGQ